MYIELVTVLKNGLQRGFTSVQPFLGALAELPKLTISFVMEGRGNGGMEEIA